MNWERWWTDILIFWEKSNAYVTCNRRNSILGMDNSMGWNRTMLPSVVLSLPWNWSVLVVHVDYYPHKISQGHQRLHHLGECSWGTGQAEGEADEPLAIYRSRHPLGLLSPSCSLYPKSLLRFPYIQTIEARGRACFYHFIHWHWRIVRCLSLAVMWLSWWS